MEKLKLCWANHIGSGATAVVSCIGAGYSHNQHVKDFNKVATAYAGVKNLYDAGRQATREVLGEKKNAELQDKINQKYIEEHPEDIKAINEYLVMACKNNILREGEFDYGNQYVVEKYYLFPEYYAKNK
jgi:hypothetical protein